MKRSYWALWSILAVAFIIFLSLAMCGDIHIAGVHIKTLDLSGWQSKDAAPSDSVAGSEASDLADRTAENSHICLGDGVKTVLIIGDSMLEGLSPRLSAYCDASGMKLYSVIWYSSTTELFGETKLLSDYIRVIRPDFIFVSLGGNELFVNDVEAKRDKYVKSIVEEIGDIPYLWIGPPNWKPDTGINDLIAKNVAPDCFFLSNGMEFERKKDGAHPTQESAIVWMDKILEWMPTHARYYLALNEPVEVTKRPTRYYIHQPGALKDRPK